MVGLNWEIMVGIDMRGHKGALAGPADDEGVGGGGEEEVEPGEVNSQSDADVCKQ